MENELEKLEQNYMELKRAVLSENARNGNSKKYKLLREKLASVRRDIAGYLN